MSDDRKAWNSTLRPGKGFRSRGKPLRTRKGLKPGGPIRPKKRGATEGLERGLQDPSVEIETIPKQETARWRRAYGSVAIVEWYGSRPCDTCGRYRGPAPDVDPEDEGREMCMSHLKTKKTGGRPWHCITQCWLCHAVWHATGPKTFALRYHGCSYEELLAQAVAIWLHCCRCLGLDSVAMGGPDPDSFDFLQQTS